MGKWKRTERGFYVKMNKRNLVIIAVIILLVGIAVFVTRNPRSEDCYKEIKSLTILEAKATESDGIINYNLKWDAEYGETIFEDKQKLTVGVGFLGGSEGLQSIVGNNWNPTIYACDRQVKITKRRPANTNEGDYLKVWLYSPDGSVRVNKEVTFE